MGFKNKKGSTIFFIFMMGIIFFVLGMALANPLKETLDEARGVDGLDCNNASISNQYKAYCTSVDIFLPLFVGLIFGLGGMLIGGIATR